jgi:hypothetical protein
VAENVYKWVCAVVKFDRVFKDMLPKRERKEEAEA